MREAYEEFLRVAGALSRSRHDARDLVQTVLLDALEHGVVDLAGPERRAWLRGALRKRAAFDARTTARRQRRELSWFGVRVAHGSSDVRPWDFSQDLLARLQPSVRTLATLVSAELSPDEIRAVLRLSGTSYRKRLSMLRRVVREASDAGVPVVAARSAAFALGPARAELIASLRRRRCAVLASHDPDGHPLLFSVRG
jgi:DNA-directed RNA polymerase specialized sigma24 family protein